MSEKHLEEIRQCYLDLGPENYDPSNPQRFNIDFWMDQVSRAALAEIPSDEKIVGHETCYHFNVGRQAQIFVTDKLLHIVHIGMFKKEKLLGAERIKPKSITGVERRRKGSVATSITWEVTISRTVEQDVLVNLTEGFSRRLVELIEAWDDQQSSESFSADPGERLRKLKELFDAGILSEDEYESKRAPLIEQL